LKEGEEPSCLKKRSKTLLFLGSLAHAVHGRDLAASAGNKSLLVLFFRKEHLS
jgi:hypothetical protein